MNKPLIRFVAMALILSLGLTTAYAGGRGGGTKISAGTSHPVAGSTVVNPNPGPAPQPQPQPKPQTQQSTNHRSSIIGSPGTRSSTIGMPATRSSTIGTPATRSSTIGSLASPGGTATNSMIGSLGNADLSSIIGNTTPVVPPGPGPDPKPGPGPDPKPGPGPGPRPHNEAIGVEYYDTGIGVEVGQVESAAPAIAPQVEQVMQNMPSSEQIQQMARQLQGPVTQQVEQAVQQLPQPMQEKLNEPIIILPRSVNAGNGSRTTRSNSNSTYGIPGMSGGNGNGPLIYNP